MFFPNSFDRAAGMSSQVAGNWRLQGLLSVLSATAVYLAGSLDEAARALGVLMLLDLLTALWLHWRRGSLSSRTGFRKTITKFTGYFITVAVGNLTGVIAPQLGFTRMLAITYLGVAEAISVLENLAAAGVDSLAGLSRRLRQVRDGMEKKDDGDCGAGS